MRERARKPLLLLDVDGPLNPHLAGPLDGWRVVRGGWGVWRISNEHGQWLRELAEVFELVWATVDDELHEEAERWARRRRQPTLLVKANPRTGLTTADLRRIEQFGASVAASTSVKRRLTSALSD